jgi:hypothetical protein
LGHTGSTRRRLLKELMCRFSDAGNDDLTTRSATGV